MEKYISATFVIQKFKVFLSKCSKLHREVELFKWKWLFVLPERTNFFFSFSFIIFYYFVYFIMVVTFVFHIFILLTNSLRRNRMLERPRLLSGRSSIQFFNSLLWFTGYHPTPLVTTIISHNLYDLRDTIPGHWISLSFPTQYLPR